MTVELYKLFTRPRTWISVLLICALPLVVAVFVAVTHLTPPPGQGSAFLSAVLENGKLYPAAALALVLPVFLPVSVAVVAGDSVAGEAASGTLRYLLIRPVGRTRLLILDEPGNGLDPHGIRDTRQLLLDLSADGVTIFLSSHLLAEVEQQCTRVGILDHGRLVLQDDLDALRGPTGRVLVESPDAGQVATLLNGQVEHRDGAHLVVRHADPAALNQRLVGAGIRVASITPQHQTLEDVVLKVTGSGDDQW